MPTMIESYLAGMTELFNRLDKNTLKQVNIELFKANVMDYYLDYQMQLIRGEGLFKQLREYKIVKQTQDDQILVDVVTQRYHSVTCFETLIHTTITDIDSLRKLRNDTVNTFTHAKENERLALYTLHLSGVCSTNVSLTIANDPTVNGFIALLHKLQDNNTNN